MIKLINGERIDHELTREEAINEHRKMWNWIADIKAKGDKEPLTDLKAIYIKNKGYQVINNCFLCDYAVDEYRKNNVVGDHICFHCPLIWGTESIDDIDIILYCIGNTKYNIPRYTERNPREVANLPEKGGF